MSLKFALLAALFGSALATPAATPDESIKILSKRGEGVHLVNCGDIYSVVLVGFSTSAWTNPDLIIA